MSIFTLRLSGPPQVEKDGTPIQGFESNKALALLGHLALQERIISRDRLVGLFWGELSEERGRGNLRRVLHNLNSLLPGCLQVNRRSVQFKSQAPCQVDVFLFETLSAQGDVASLKEAMQWYGGDLLEGLSLTDCPEFELWLVAERERWHQRVVCALDILTEHHVRQGDYHQALEYVDRLLIIAPWRETSHREKIELLAHTGQRGAALRQYEICRRILAKELNIEPLPETTALYERIRAAGTHPRHTLKSLDSDLSAPTTSFVGRQAEIAEIGLLLSNPDCRLLTLTGPGGVGKTRLALQAVSQLPHCFLDGAVLVPLGMVALAQLLPTAMAQALALTFHGRMATKQQLFSYLQGKELLLILDDFEHLLDGASLLIELLRQAPHVKLLVTSRERLKLRDEWVFALKGLPVHADGSDQSPAVTLFLRRVHQAGQQAFVSAEETRPIVRICDLLEGNPLGIELAAALTPYTSCAEIAHRIEHDLGFLTSPLCDAPPRHRSLQAVFESSWRQLAPREQRLLAQLTVFRDGFRARAAKQIAGATLPLITALVGKSLLHATSVNRYCMHEMVRQFAAEKLSQMCDSESLRGIHGQYYAAFLQNREHTLLGKNQQVILDEIEEEIDNVRVAWRWAIETEHILSIRRATKALARFYQVRGWFQEAMEAFNQATDCLEKLKERQNQAFGKDATVTLGQVLIYSGMFHGHLGLHEDSATLLEKSVRLLRPISAQKESATALVQLGLAYLNLGRFEESNCCCEEGLAVLRKMGSRWDIANALNALGNIYYVQGRYTKAALHYQEGADLFETVGDRRGLAVAFNNLGNIAHQRDNLVEAREWHLKSLSIKQSVSDQWGISISLYNLGELAYLLGDYTEAQRFLQESIELSTRVGYRVVTAESLNRLGDVAWEMEAYNQAHNHYRAALQVSEGTDNASQIAASLSRLSKVARHQGNFAQARRHCEQALRLTTNPLTTLATLIELAQLMAVRGTGDKALEIASFVVAHPATQNETKKQAQRLIAQCQTDLPAHQASITSESKSQRSLDETVAEVLKDSFFVDPDIATRL